MKLFGKKRKDAGGFFWNDEQLVPKDQDKVIAEENVARVNKNGTVLSNVLVDNGEKDVKRLKEEQVDF